MKIKEVKTTIYEYDSVSELTQQEIILIELSRKTALKAYSPYSNFKVGAALLLENGELIEGNNQENAAYPSGLCAERVAMFYANAKFPDIAVMAVAVCVFKNGEFTDIPVPPCGACRQVLIETEQRYGNKIKVILAGREKVNILMSASDLLPLSFDGNML